MATKRKLGAVDRFIALSDAERDAIVARYDAGPIPRSELTEMTPAQRRRWEKFQAGLQATHAAKEAARLKPIPKQVTRPAARPAARPSKPTAHQALLKQADAYAKKHGLNRAQLVAAGLRMAMAAGVTAQTLGG